MLIPLPYKLLAIVLALLGIFAFGYKKGLDSGKEAINRAVAEAAELQVALEREQANIKERVVVEYVDRVKVVTQKEIVYREAASTKVPSQYELSNGWVYLHDASVRGEDLDPNKTSDATPSVVKDNVALGTVLSNYATCLQNAEQLIALQSWIIQSQEAIKNPPKGEKK